MWHESAGMGYELNNFIRQQIGFYGRNPITLNAFHFIQCFHQIKKSLSGSLTKITNIHTCKYNLFSTFGNSLTGLFYHRSNRSVPAPPTGKGNRTIRTEIITAILYLQEKAGTISA